MKTISIIAALATIVGVIYTIWNNNHKPNKPSNMKNKQYMNDSPGGIMAGGNVNIDNSTKTFIGAENKEITVEELYRQPITILRAHFRIIWLKLFVIFSFLLFAYISINSLLNLKERLTENPLPSNIKPLATFAFMSVIVVALYFYQVFSINQLFPYGKNHIVNYSGKLYKVRFQAKCHCTGKVKIKQNLLNRDTPNYLQCQADKSHIALFYPGMFDENNYATTGYLGSC